MKKNILILIATLKFGGGAEKSATLVGNDLQKRGYKVSYLTFYESEKKYDFFGEEFCLNEKSHCSFLINILNLLNRAYKIKKYCKKNKIDSVISHLEEANFASIISKIFFLNKPKLVITIHNDLLKAYYNNFLTLSFIKIFYKYSDIIVPTSFQMESELIKHFGIKKDKSKMIYNSFELEKISKLSEESLLEFSYLFDKDFTFINIGRLTKQKNHKLLLDSFELFNKKYSNVNLLLLHGEGDLESYLKSYVGTLDSKNNIHFLGSHSNPFKFLKNSDCYVCSSSWEGFSMLFIESMTCGLPFISTDHDSGVKELLRNNKNYSNVDSLKEEDFGILVPDKNPNELFKAMEKIYLNEDLKNKYKEKSLQRSKDFDLNNIIKEWENIL